MELFNDHVPLMKPLLDETEWLALKEVILSGWVSQGPKVQEFEQQVANLVGAKHAVATNSCTSAMHLVLRYLGVKPGDEVILPNSTCMANANAVIMAGGVPKFADVAWETNNISVEDIDKVRSSKTKVIMGVDQIGLPADLDKIAQYAKNHNLGFLDDAATAFGATYKEKLLGGHGYVSTFSFHPRKVITTGEGGMLVTNDSELAKKAKVWGSAGADVSDLERHKSKGAVMQKYPEPGYNYRMTDMQAAIGIVQLTRLENILSERKRQAEIYNNAFKNHDQVQIPFVPEYATHCYSSYLLKLTPDSKIKRDEIVVKMAEAGISCRYGIQPLHREPYFEGLNIKDKDFPNTVAIAERSFFLPIFPGMTSSQQERVIDSLLKLMARK